MEVERGRLSYVAACRSLGRFLRGFQAGIEQVFFSPKDALFLHDRRRDLYVFGAWIPKLSGMRRRTASHCVFRRIRAS